MYAGVCLPTDIRILRVIICHIVSLTGVLSYIPVVGVTFLPVCIPPTICRSLDPMTSSSVVVYSSPVKLSFVDPNKFNISVFRTVVLTVDS